jgi:signal transduction histidine kinase/ActR/RegA family two-component response regulator
MHPIKHWFWNLISCGLPADEDLETLRKVILLNLMFIIGGFFLALLCVVAFLQGAYFLSAVDLTVLSLLFGLFFYLKKTINHKLVGTAGTVAIGVFYFWLIAYGGVSQTAHIWSLTYPLIAVYLLGKKLGSLFSIMLLAMAGIVFALGSRVDYFTFYNIDLILRFVPAYMIIYLFAMIMEKVRETIQFRLKSSKVNLEKTFKKVKRQTKALTQSNLELHAEILERERVEKALRKSESFLHDVIESIQDGISVLSPDLTISHTNSVMTKWYQDKMPLIGKKCYECYQNRSQPCDPCPTLRCLQTGQAACEVVPGPGSSIDWIELYSFPIKDTETGEVTGVVEFVRDITDHMRLERQLAQAQKMEAVGTLAGGVAHDLNNILSGIVSYPDLLLMDLPADSPLREPIKTMQASGKKAAAIVQDLLTLARRGVSVSEVVNLNEIIKDYLGSPQKEKLLSFHSGIEFNTDLDPKALNIMGSSVHLSKTVMNLVANAAEAMPDGGRISIATENRYIDQPIAGYDDVEEGDYVLLTVADGGIGIPKDEFGRIFEPFYTKKVMGRSGTGLGMAVVWGTVKDHKGYIHIESREGMGTAFKLYFPVTRMPRNGDENPISINDYRGNGETILVVDDIEEQRTIASKLLKHLGYAVDTAASGEEAVAYMKANRADLVVLDMIMPPGIDGLETYKQLIARRPEQKAIIASGFSETDRVKKAQHLGAGCYVKKPYTMEKIGMAVKAELATSQPAV